jgi:Arc/MetJ-type ribon-helix-helix transcriptional regulator
MTIHLPNDVERSIEAAVMSGRFASVDAAMEEAARRLLRDLGREPRLAIGVEDSDSLLGSMPEAADELDAIVADAMKRRREGPWRTSTVE